ncbi:MAG TPA: hypothetical protein VGN17_19560 [Bryobacteraceae bacterium]|jgi:hypothetical protein
MAAMLQALAAILFAGIAVAQSVPQAEIARAAKSPYDLARYLETHTDFDWAPLWQTLGSASPASVEPCVTASDRQARCSTEVIGLLNPDQAIVVVQGGLGLVELYLRFLDEPEGAWKFAGAYGASIKNRDPMHQVVRLGGRPILKVAIQTPNFRGPSIVPEPNEKEVWFDLSARDFEPVFSFPTDSDQDVNPDGITRHVSAVPRVDGADAIDLLLTVDFDFFGFQLGQEEFMGRYERHADEKDFSLRSAQVVASRAAMPVQDFLDLSDILFQPAAERMLVYALPGLKELAGSKRSEAKEELRLMLAKCKDTPEKRTLLALMGEK